MLRVLRELIDNASFLLQMVRVLRELIYNAYFLPQMLRVLRELIDNACFLPQMVRVLRELSPVLHMANLLASEMIHFVHQMAYYITFEVQ
jgi:hypothetical protein